MQTMQRVVKILFRELCILDQGEWRTTVKKIYDPTVLKRPNHIDLVRVRVYFIFLFILLRVFSLAGQSENIHQHQKDFKNQDLRSNLTHPEDTLVVLSLVKRAGDKFNTGRDFDSIRQWLHSAISLSKEINYPSGVANSSAKLGFYYFIQNLRDSARIYLKIAINATPRMEKHPLALYHLWYGWTFNYNSTEIDSSLHMFRLSYTYAIESKDTFMIQAIATQIIEKNLAKGKTIEATKLCLEMKAIAELRHDTAQLIRNACMLSKIFGVMNLRERQRDMMYAALQLPENSIDTQLLLLVYGMAAELYLDRHQYDSVLYYSGITERLSQKLVTLYPEIQIPNWINLIKALLNMNRLDSAKQYHAKVVDVLDHSQYPSCFYAEYAGLELKMGYETKANEHFIKAAIEVQNENGGAKMGTYQLLYEHYEALGLEDKAYQFLKQYDLYKDSLQKNQIAFNAEYLIMEFETEKKEAEIKRLSMERELQSLVAVKQRQKKNLAYGSMGLLVFAGAFGFYRFRQYKNLKSKEALSNERLRISRDLHDEVGATLSGISMYSHLVKEQIKSANPEAVFNSLNLMQESSGEMVGKLNDIVWLLNPDQSHLPQLVDKLEGYATQMAGARDIMVVMEIDDRISDLGLPLEVRRNVYLICKEAINNVVKYSQASALHIQVRYIDQVLEFSIHDNGVGFDPATIKRGNGLNNMQRRAEEIGGNLDFVNDPTGGTTIVLKCKTT